jgi:hypothetical protein
VRGTPQFIVVGYRAEAQKISFGLGRRGCEAVGENTSPTRSEAERGGTGDKKDRSLRSWRQIGVFSENLHSSLGLCASSPATFAFNALAKFLVSPGSHQLHRHAQPSTAAFGRIRAPKTTWEFNPRDGLP